MKAWAEMSHPEWTQLTVADVWQDERARLMPNPVRLMATWSSRYGSLRPH